MRNFGIRELTAVDGQAQVSLCHVLQDGASTDRIEIGKGCSISMLNVWIDRSILLVAEDGLAYLVLDWETGRVVESVGFVDHSDDCGIDDLNDLGVLIAEGLVLRQSSDLR